MRYYRKDKTTGEITQIKKRDAEKLVGRHCFDAVLALRKSGKTEPIKTPFGLIWREK